MTEEFRIIGYVLIAMTLGGMVGLDRENLHKPAGLRTHMLVAGISALLPMLSSYLINDINFDASAGVNINADPIRIIQAVVVGIGFFGGGTIIKRSSDEVEGLTTAASLLFTVGIGVAVALSKFVIATGMTVLALFALLVIAKLREKSSFFNNGGESV